MRGKIKIGTFWPFTGPPGVRVIAPKLWAGTASCLTVFNERGGMGGRQVELIVQDSGYDTTQTAIAARKLVEDDGVIALLNANGTPQITEILPYLQKRAVPLLLPFAGAQEWYNPPRPGVLGLNSPFNDIGILLGRWAVRDGHRQIAILYPDYPPISAEMAQRVTEGFIEAGAEVADLICVPLGSQDGAVMADAIERAVPEALVILTNLPELRAATSVLHSRGTALPLYSWNANVTQAVAASLGELIDGMKGYSDLIADPLSDHPSIREYREVMARDFPEQAPDALSLQSFGHTAVFLEALSRISGPVTGRALVDALYSLDDFETGILPPVTFNRTKHIGIDAVQPMHCVSRGWMPCGPLATLPSHEN